MLQASDIKLSIVVGKEVIIMYYVRLMYVF